MVLSHAAIYGRSRHPLWHTEHHQNLSHFRCHLFKSRQYQGKFYILFLYSLSLFSGLRLRLALG